MVPAIIASEKVNELERVMLSMEQADCELTHHFGDGIYIRQVTMKAGSVVVGHHQNFPHMNNFIAGKVLMLQEDGSVLEMSAPMVFNANAGRKVGIILEDVIWQNIYPTNETDVDKLESHFITKSDCWMKDASIRVTATMGKLSYIRESYHSVLEEFGISHEVALTVSQNEADRIDVNLIRCQVGQSLIEGNGLFASGTFYEGDLIAPARINGLRTQAGRYTNHSPNPNARMVELPNGDIDLVAIKKISGCKGGQKGEEILIDYRATLKMQGLGEK